jgi:hypothetical protein
MPTTQPTQARTLRHSASAHPLLVNRVEQSWNNSPTATTHSHPSPLSAGHHQEQHLTLRPPLPDLGTCYGPSLDGPVSARTPQDSVPPLPTMNHPLPTILPRSATPQAPRNGPILAQMTMNRGPSPLDPALGRDGMQMNNHGHNLVDSPSWSSATRNPAEEGVDYRMDLTIDQGHHLGDSHRVGQTQLVSHPLSASPHPPPTPTSAITIPMVFDHHRPMPPSNSLSHTQPPPFLGLPTGAPPPQVETVGHRHLQDGALNSMHSTSTAAPLALALPLVNGQVVDQMRMGQTHSPVQGLSYHRSTFPPPPPLLPSRPESMHTGLGAGGMGTVGMGWQGVLLPIKAESPPPNRLHMD